MFKKLLQRKSKLSLAIDAVIVILAIFIMIPPTRTATITLMLRPTAFLYQAPLLKEPIPLYNISGEWRLRTLSGDTCQLADFAGKPIVLNYWASWCAPCMAEMSEFQKLYRDYSDKVNFLFVNNEDRREIAKLVKRKKWDFPVFFPIGKYPEQLSTNSLPTTFVIDADGNIVLRKSGIANWNSGRMRNILNSLIDKGKANE